MKIWTGNIKKISIEGRSHLSHGMITIHLPVKARVSAELIFNANNNKAVKRAGQDPTKNPVLMQSTILSSVYKNTWNLIDQACEVDRM